MQLISEFPAAADRQFIDKTGLEDMWDVEDRDSALSAEVIGILDIECGTTCGAASQEDEAVITGRGIIDGL